jgi:hypothetical protein
LIDQRAVETAIVNGLKQALQDGGFTCEVIRANQTSPTPAYPYVSYTITTPVVADAKGWSRAEDGTAYKPLPQIWSLTSQSDDDTQSVSAALLAYEWFDETGRVYLSDNGITVQRVGNVGNRDNLITTQYEHRNGFDVTFLLMHQTVQTVEETSGIIETAVPAET